MNIRPVLVMAATAFLAAAPTAQSDDNVSEMKPATNVAEMLQRRQESELREQWIKEGRWDEVRKLEDAQARRQHERQVKAVAQMNEELARSVKADSPANSVTFYDCDKETLRLRNLNSAHVDKNDKNISAAPVY